MVKIKEYKSVFGDGGMITVVKALGETLRLDLSVDNF